MGKIRVHQLAKDLGLPNKELIEKLKSLGFEVKTHSSSVDEDDARSALQGTSSTAAKAEIVKPKKVRTVLRRRRSEPEEDGETAVEVSSSEGEDAGQATETSQGPEALADGAPADVGDPPDDAGAVQMAGASGGADEAGVGETSAEVSGGSAEGGHSGLAAEASASSEENIDGGAGERSVRVPPPAKVSKVVRVIDADAIKARLASEGKNFQPRAPRRVQQVRELRVVQDQFGRGPTMVDVTRDRGGRRGGRRGSGPREGGGAMTRRDMLEMRAGARDMWRTPGKKRRSSKRGQKTEITEMAAHKRIIEVPGTISVGDLAKQMAIKAGEVLGKLMSMGMMVTINQTIDYDTAAIIANEFNYEAKNVAFEEENLLEAVEVDESAMESRAPVVTIMGHVDHGKTSLLDKIRESRVVDGEAGGITQHIGAYSVQVGGNPITFLDTPGHAAFTAMRARGAQVTDLVILVVAADDGVMPQTVEAINHSKSAGVPIIVAVNKIDKPDSSPDRVMQALTEYELVAEQWGGDVIFAPVSAKEGTGIQELLEAVLLQAEMLDLKANRERPAQGTIIEAQLDKGRGPVATVLVQQGTLKTGDSVVSGDFFGRVRGLFDDQSQSLEEAGPSTPVQVIGIAGVPNAGDSLDVVSDEKIAKTIAEHRAQKTREHELAKSAKVTLENFLQRAKADEALELNLIVKADVQGSVEAVTQALERLSNKQVTVSIVHHAVGAISESDVNLAATSQAVIIGFGVRPDTKALHIAEKNHVDVKLYTIIYEAIEGVRDAMEGKLPSTTIENYLGRAEVRQTFFVPKVGTVAGCAVIDGKLLRNARVRLLRDGVVLHDGKLSSLKRFKDDAREVVQGYECGTGIEGYNDLKVGDLIECYELTEIATKLKDPDLKPEGDRPQASA